MSFYCLHGFWWELAVNLIEDPFYLSNHFFLAAFKVVCLSTVWLLCVSVWISIYPVYFEIRWASWMCWFISFVKYGKRSSIISSNIHSASFSPLWDSHYAYFSIFVGVPQGSWALLNPSSKFFISIFVFSALRFLFGETSLSWFPFVLCPCFSLALGTYFRKLI